MSFELFTVGGKLATLYNRSKALTYAVDPYNPLNLPPNTIRVRTSNGNAPRRGIASYETAALVPGTTDVYDVYKSGTSFDSVLAYSDNVVEVLGANTSNVTDMNNMFAGCWHLTTVPLFDTSSATNMGYMFDGCSSLTSVPLFDTSKVTNMENMFRYCSSLTSVPLFDTSNVKYMDYMFGYCSNLTTVLLFDTSKVWDMNHMFDGCYKVESGALALYQQASSQATPPWTHDFTFKNCGRNTVTGAAELAQIPSDWK